MEEEALKNIMMSGRGTGEHRDEWKCQWWKSQTQTNVDGCLQQYHDGISILIKKSMEQYL